MAGTLGREVISTRQRKIAELAQREPKLTLTTLAHHVDDVWMREAYRRIRKDAAAGVDGVTAAQYEADLEANLSGLLERFKSGRYRAPAVRRVHLEKPGTSVVSRFVSWNPQGSSPVCSVDGLPGMTEQSGKRLESVPSPFS